MTAKTRLISLILICAALACSFCFPARGDDDRIAAAYLYIAEAIGNAVPVYNDTLKKEVATIDISQFDLTRDEMKSICSGVYYNNPQFFYWKGGYNYGYVGQTMRTIYAYFEYPAAELPALKEEFAGMAEELYALCPADFSALEKALFYHDYLASNFEYDGGGSIGDVYSFLKEGRGVCQAYSGAFLLAMKHFEIPCTYARSDMLNHIWNVVFIDGAWYHLDVTYDDPLRDRAGQARHTWFLTGALSTATIGDGKKDVTDIEFGDALTISAADHPFRALIADSTAPAVAVEGSLYGILGGSEEGQANVVGYLADECGYRNLFALPDTWRIPNNEQSVYAGNFSTLASDGQYLFYNDDAAIYAYDPFTDEAVEVWDCPPDTALYGVQYRDGALIAYTAVSPSALPYTAMPVTDPLPVPNFYTVTWIVGDQTFSSRAREGSDPLDSFNGSTEFEGEDGLEYYFKEWSPKPVEVTGDVTYTAVFIIRETYLAGDVDEDDMLSINDVSLLLDRLSAGVTEATVRTDVNGDGVVDIDDVSALLDLLAVAGEE